MAPWAARRSTMLRPGEHDQGTGAEQCGHVGASLCSTACPVQAPGDRQPTPLQPRVTRPPRGVAHRPLLATAAPPPPLLLLLLPQSPRRSPRAG
eukprot:357339-Chlamydomonas_euryale.AAC.5